MKVVEVQFEGHARMPDSQRASNVIRAGSGKDNAIGGSVLVDTLEVQAHGIFATKTVERVVDNEKRIITFRKLYAWNTVKEVVYDSESVASKSESSQLQKAAGK